MIKLRIFRTNSRKSAAAKLIASPTECIPHRETPSRSGRERVLASQQLIWGSVLMMRSESAF
jgi:hypothetical protein